MILSSLDQVQGAPAATEPDPGFGDIFDASREAEAAVTDAWSYGLRVRMDVQRDIYDRLPPEAQQRTHEFITGRGPDEDTIERFLLDEAGKARSAGDPAWQDLPATAEDITAEVNRRRRAVIDEASEMTGDSLTLPGFLGRMTTAATDPTSLAMIPLGGGGGGLLRITAREAVLGMLGEAAVLPREFEVAEELDLPEPDVAQRLLLGAGFGAGIGAGLASIPRVFAYATAKRRAADATKPAGVNPVDFRDEVEAARDEIETGTTRPTGPQPPLRLSDFDFAPGGNASAQTNRVGYVFGRLIERGMEPHIAAGFVGNFMVESGPVLNPQAIGDGGAALGIAQWNDRRAALIAFANARGKPPTDLDVQIDFVFHELQTSEARAAQRIFQARSAQEAAQLVSDLYERPGIPHLPRRLAHASAIFDQYGRGQVPKWDGNTRLPEGGGSSFTGYASSRPYTTTGQVVVGEDLRVDVEYEVVDLARLRQATGDLQPRDRGRASSDAWVADTAARLDPAQLLDSPWADRGAPLVGPDDVIESGNGRVRAIARAYDQVPDRADAYRQAIEARTGQPIPEGIEQPVLIARRTSELDEAARRRMVVDAQDSGVARMNATERAQIGQRALDADMLGRYRTGFRLGTAENRDFARAFAGAFPRSERNAFIAEGGQLSIDGIRQIQDSLFARAWDAPDIVARAVEAEPGEMKTLIDALADAAPEVARLRAEIEAGLVSPEMDITPHVLEAVRLIMQARDAAARGGAVAEIVEELLADEDLLLGALSPLTRALVRKFMPNGKQAPAGKIAAFLKDYATEARQAGRTGGALDPVGPLDVLKRLDRETFGGLTETGAVRADPAAPRGVEPSVFPENAFADGASSPEAEAADRLALEALEEVADEGPFGPVFAGYANNPKGAIGKLMQERRGEVPDAVTHPELDAPIAFVFGQPNPPGKSRGGFGLAHILEDHDAATLDMLPEIIRNGAFERLGTRVQITHGADPAHRAIVVLNYNGQEKNWVLTAYRLHPEGKTARHPRSIYGTDASASPALPDATGQGEYTPTSAALQDDPSDAIRAAIADFQATAPDLARLSEDGPTFREILDDLDADEVLDTILDACTLKGGA